MNDRRANDHLSQQDIIDITGYQRQKQQEETLRDLGYVVLGRNGRNQVMALALHPNDPRVKLASDAGQIATLEI